jgi:hypothetical protein
LLNALESGAIQDLIRQQKASALMIESAELFQEVRVVDVLQALHEQANVVVRGQWFPANSDVCQSL